MRCFLHLPLNVALGALAGFNCAGDRCAIIAAAHSVSVPINPSVGGKRLCARLPVLCNGAIAMAQRRPAAPAKMPPITPEPS